MGKPKHLIVISIDALNIIDKQYIKGLSNFKSFFEEGSYAEEVIGIYPSLTYPSHASIITGTYPNKHGIYSNTKNQPGVKNLEWFWYKKDIKFPSLVDLVKQNRMSVGSILWPVMAGADINWNCPEIWSTNPKNNQILTSLKNGTPLFLLYLNFKYGKLLNGHNQPNLDNFITSSACYMVKKKKPNLSLIHLIDVDHTRHMYGLNSYHIKEALNRTNDRIGQIIQSTRQAGIYNDCTFILLGDHGFSDFNKIININVKFVEENLITLDNENNIIDWKAHCNTCDGSAQIYIKNNKNQKTYQKVYNILNSMTKNPETGIEKVYTKQELEKRYKLSGDFTFMVEAKDGFCFGNNHTGKQFITTKELKKQYPNEEIYSGHHGYDPFKPAYRTLFIAKGSGIKKGVSIPTINLVDEAPTMAALLGLKMRNVDGRILDEILL